MRHIWQSAAIVALVLSSAAQAENLTLTSETETLVVDVDEIAAVFMHGQPSVQVKLSDASSTAMAQLTENMIGETLTLSLCDTPLLQAIVRERLEGRAILNMPSIEAALAVAEVVQGEATCEDIATHFPD